MQMKNHAGFLREGSLQIQFIAKLGNAYSKHTTIFQLVAR